MNLEQLKATIEAEALRRQSARDGFTLDAVKAYLGQAVAAPVRPTPAPPPQPLTYAWFAGLHGRELVEACYTHLLGREADVPGLNHHLAALLNGADKALIVGGVRYSAEGRARGVPVAGLLPRFAAVVAQRVPVVGIFVGWLVALATLNGRMRHARAIEEHLRAQLDTMSAHVDRANVQVAMRIEALRTVLQARD